MRLSTIIIIIILILALYYYTAETFDVVEVVGKHVYKVVKTAFADVLEIEETEPSKQKDNEFLREPKGLFKKIRELFSR